jgi:hypothetical protein
MPQANARKMLAVVVSDVEIESEYQFERRMFGSNPEQLRSLAAWLIEQKAEEIVMESTAQYWKPVWETLERYWKPLCGKREGARRRSGTLHLTQALSNRGRRGRKRDFVDAERLMTFLESPLESVDDFAAKDFRQHFLGQEVFFSRANPARGWMRSTDTSVPLRPFGNLGYFVMS